MDQEIAAVARRALDGDGGFDAAVALWPDDAPVTAAMLGVAWTG